MNVDEKRQIIVIIQLLLYIYTVYFLVIHYYEKVCYWYFLYLQTVKDGKNLCCYVSMLIKK